MTKAKVRAAKAPEGRCPWCSSPVAAGADRCPSCGAALKDPAAAEADEIPGVTQVDPALGMRRGIPRPNRLVGWLADVDTDLPAASPRPPRLGGATGGAQGLEPAGQASVAPPSEEVRREMARLELQALTAELEARAAEARAEAALSSETVTADGPARAPAVGDTAERGGGAATEAGDTPGH